MESQPLQCPICRQDYNLAESLPRLLPVCGHSLCEKCLIDLIAASEFRCPLDKRKFIGDMKSIDTFPINFTVRHLIEENLEWEVCKDHNEKIKLVCFNDKCKVCAYCVVYGGHRDHVIKPILEMKSEVDTKRKQLETAMESLDGYYHQLDKLLEEKRVSLIKSVESQFKEMSIILRRKEMELTVQLNSFFNQQKRSLDCAFGDNSSLKTEITDKVECYRSFIKNPEVFGLIEEDISQFTTKLDDSELNVKVQELNEKLSEVSNAFQSLLASHVDSLNHLEVPTSTFAEKLEAMYPQSLMKDATVAMAVEESNKTQETSVVRLETSLKFDVLDEVFQVQVGSEDLVPVEVDFESLKKVKQAELALNGFEFGEKDMKVLSYVWSKLEPVHTIGIDISEQEQISENDIIALMSFTFHQPQHLTEIYFKFGDSKIKDQALIYFSEEVLPKTTRLKNLSLDLKKTCISEASLLALSKSFSQKEKGLDRLRLNLEEIKLPEDALIQVLENVSTLKTLKLGLANTQLSDRGLEMIAKSVLPQMSHLVSLEILLNRTKVSNQSVIQLLASLPDVEKLMINLENTKVTDKGVDAFIKNKLPAMKSLKELKVGLEGTKVKETAKNQLKGLRESNSVDATY